jgi:hypothetical protein
MQALRPLPDRIGKWFRRHILILTQRQNDPRKQPGGVRQGSACAHVAAHSIPYCTATYRISTILFVSVYGPAGSLCRGEMWLAQPISHPIGQPLSHQRHPLRLHVVSHCQAVEVGARGHLPSVLVSSEPDGFVLAGVS